MRKHPKNKNIVDAAAETSTSIADGAVLEHIAECETCRKIYTSARKIIETSDNSIIKPSPGLKSRILYAYDNMQTSSPGIQKSFIQKIRIKPALTAYTAAGLALVIIAGLLINPLKTRCEIKIEKINGSAFITDKQGDKTDRIIPGSAMITKKKSYMQISSDSNLKIKLAENSEISINDSYFKSDNEKYNYIFSLKKGTIHAALNRNQTYSFLTEKAVIRSSDSEFLLMKKERTELYLAKGSIYVRGLDESKFRILHSGKKFIIDERIRSAVLTQDEITIVKKIAGSDSDEFNSNIILLSEITPAPVEKNIIKNQNTQSGKAVSERKVKLQQKPEKLREQRREIKNEIKREMQREMKQQQREVRVNRNDSRDMRREGRRKP